MMTNSELGFPFDFYPYSKITTIYFAVCFVLLLAGMTYWYLGRILKLHQKSFHLFMYIFNMISFTIFMVGLTYMFLWYKSIYGATNPINQSQKLQSQTAVTYFRTYKTLVTLFLSL